jgi:peroxiredoxin
VRGRRLAVAILLGATLIAPLAMIAGGCRSSGPPAPPAVGDLAPDFVLQSSAGVTRKLSNYRGKVVLVNHWATWCPPCIAELPVLDKLAKDYADKGLVVLGVAGDDDSRAVTDFLARQPVHYEVLFDPGGAIGTQYGITGYPETFFVDREGRVRKQIIGPVPAEGAPSRAEFQGMVESLLGG